MLIIITEIEHALLRGVLPHLLIKRGPVITAFFGIDFLIEVVQLRMMLMDPVENTLTVIAAQIQILQPDEIALVLGTLYDGHHKTASWRQACAQC